MVTAVSNYGRSGLHDFVVQRVSAVILAAYTLYLVGFIIFTPEVTYQIWANLFDQLWMRIFSFMALLSVAAHGWIGLWVILTDYVTERLMGPKSLALRIAILSVYAVVTFAYLVWGVEILWGA